MHSLDARKTWQSRWSLRPHGAVRHHLERAVWEEGALRALQTGRPCSAVYGGGEGAQGEAVNDGCRG